MSDDEDIDYLNAHDDPGYRGHSAGKAQTSAEVLSKHVASAPVQTTKLTCKVCNVEAGPAVTVWRPERLCSVCQGKKNREVMDEVPPAIRALKFGSNSEIADATRTLKRIFGEADALETVNLIAKLRAEGKYQGNEKTRKGSFK